MTYSVDFRRHVLSIRKKEWLAFAQASERFGIGIASLTRWSKQVELKATRENRPRKIDLDKLAKDVETHPDAYQYERAMRFGVTPKAIWQALRKLGGTYKKKPFAIPRRTQPDLLPSRRRSSDMRRLANPLSILMKVVLPMICRAHTVTRSKVCVVLAP